MKILNYCAEYEYVISEGTRLFTVVLKPKAEGEFPAVIIRNPYVDHRENSDENDILVSYMKEYQKWLENGYAIVLQHCRGRGKSDGDCIAYINEREDTLNLYGWVRKQPFYNGELFLKGRSYLTSVHYVAAPYGDDIKGASFPVQDSNRYNICYRNGFFKRALHGNWYVKMYKAKSHMKKNFTEGSFDLLPLKDFSKTVFGEPSADFDEMLKAPNPDNEFWKTRYGGAEAKNATDNVNFPVLFTTGFYDIYTGGVFDMWNKMSEKARKMSALVVSPYDHGDRCNEANSMIFDNGRITEKFGEDYEIEWFNHIRDNSKKPPFEKGKVTYYRLFENKWATDDFVQPADSVKIRLGEDEVSYVYNPFDAPEFKGGLSRAFGGTEFQDKPNLRHDIITVYTKPFEKETFVKGKMSAKLTVESDCEDTCFFIRISIEKEQGDLGLRDDITSLCWQLGDYLPNSKVELVFDFDEHAFLIKKGERLRIDISSADNAHYVRHTNNKGLFSEQTTAKVAHNKVYLNESFIELPTE